MIPPTCLSSWKGHLKKIVSVCYVERFKAILTASHDCTVKLWLLTGRHVGSVIQLNLRQEVLEGWHLALSPRSAPGLAFRDLWGVTLEAGNAGTDDA